MNSGEQDGQMPFDGREPRPAMETPLREREAELALAISEELSRQIVAKAHDLNNALSVIIGNTDLVQMHLPVGHGASHSVDAISKAGRRAAELVRQIMALSRRSDQEPQLVQLRPAVKEMGTGGALLHGAAKSHAASPVAEKHPDQSPSARSRSPTAETSPVVRGRVVEFPRGRGERILFVEDEEPLRQAAKSMVERLAFESVVAADGNAGLAAFRAAPDHYSVVITDLCMPGMNGLELAKRLLQIRPDLPIILATGYGGEMNLDLVRGGGICGLLPKPFTFEQLASAVRRALSNKRMSRGEAPPPTCPAPVQAVVGSGPRPVGRTTPKEGNSRAAGLG